MTLHIKLCDDSSLKASLHATLADAPESIRTQGVWLFAYGVLVAAPPLSFKERRIATLQDRHRSFNLADPVNRGTAVQPGLVLGLEEGGLCQGLAFRVDTADLPDALMPVWRQEMRLPAYKPQWIKAGTEQGPITVLVFDTDPGGPLYRQGLSVTEVATRLAGASGPAGTNLSYLEETIDGFAEAGVHDPYLEAIAALIRDPAGDSGSMNELMSS
jgi:cation transport protein ChaC